MAGTINEWISYFPYYTDNMVECQFAVEYIEFENTNAIPFGMAVFGYRANKAALLK
jgi:hypothetical protein